MSESLNRGSRLDPVEQRQMCVTANMCDKTVRKILRGEPVRTVCMYRFKAALVHLGWASRFPELFKAALGGAADDPSLRLEPEDAEEAPTTHAAV